MAVKQWNQLLTHNCSTSQPSLGHHTTLFLLPFVALSFDSKVSSPMYHVKEANQTCHRKGLLRLSDVFTSYELLLLPFFLTSSSLFHPFGATCFFFCSFLLQDPNYLSLPLCGSSCTQRQVIFCKPPIVITTFLCLKISSGSH